MGVALQVIFVLLAIACLIVLTHIVAFYHMFESKRDAMDDYTITAIVIFIILFLIFFRLAVKG